MIGLVGSDNPFAGNLVEWTWTVRDLDKQVVVPEEFSAYASQADGGPTIEMSVGLRVGVPYGTFVPPVGGQWLIVLVATVPIEAVVVDKLTVRAVPKRVP